MKKLKPLRVLVCGGRDYGLKDDGAQYVKLVNTLNTIAANGARQVTIIHGGAKGADACAGQWASVTRTPTEVYPADWYKADGTLDKGAGFRRNELMLTKKPDVVVAFPGGNGTAHMCKIARLAGVKVFEVPA
jgi:predicted Rossmann-fold nucleotide-binding protein